jgi:hypothetical protein
MATYQIDTDNGTFEVETEDPSPDHPEYMAPGSEKLVDAVAAMVTPSVEAPKDTSLGGYFSRALQAGKEAVLAPIAPFIPSLRNRLFNPNAGTYGPSRMLEEEGVRLGNAVRPAAQNIAEDIATTQPGEPGIGANIQNPILRALVTGTSPTAAPYVKAAAGALLGTAADVTSQSLTPSSFQQQIGSEVGGPILSRASRVLEGTTIDAARRALGFQKSQLTSTRSPFEAARKMAQANMASEEMLKSGNIPFFGNPTKMQKNAVKLLSGGKGEAGAVLDSVDRSGGLLEPRAGQPSPELPRLVSNALGSPSELSESSRQALRVAEKTLPDLSSFDPRVTQTPGFVKAKIDAAGVVDKYAAVRGEAPSRELFSNLFREMHDGMHDAVAKGPEAIKIFQERYPNLAEDFYKISRYKLFSEQYADKGYLSSLAQIESRINVKRLDNAFTKAADPTNGAELRIAESARQDITDRMANGSISLNDLDALRQRWGQLGFQDKTVGTDAANVYRRVWKFAGNFIKEHLKEIDPKLAASYASGMKKQEVAMTALKGIMNKTAAEAGNMPVSLPGIIVGASQGDLPKALAAAGIFEVAKRRGAAMAANTMFRSARAVGQGARPGSFSALITAARRRQK